jgi:hypothetical protein
MIVTFFFDYTFVSDFDASCGLAQDLAVDSLVSSVKVQLSDSARIALASIEKWHHKVIKELLAKKWDFSISRTEATLKASIQLSLQSAIMPLSLQYMEVNSPPTAFVSFEKTNLSHVSSVFIPFSSN